MRTYILETAQSLLDEHPETSLDEIAATIGTTTAHIRTYFDTFDELCAALAREAYAARRA